MNRGTRTREDDLRRNLADLAERVDAACAAAGRDPADLTTVVVTKTYPASDVALLVGLGVGDVGENRHPEAGDKRAELTTLLAPDVPAPRLHFVGGLQTNKAGAVARYADVVQSVDRAKLARSLSRGAEAAERGLEVLLQIDFDRTDPGRAGVAPDGLLDLADVVADLPGLTLRGGHDRGAAGGGAACRLRAAPRARRTPPRRPPGGGRRVRRQ